VEFEFPSTAYAKSGMLEGMDSSASAGYYVNRYWSMWKLPMYGATDADSVLAECKKAAKAFPGAFIRLVGFDAERQARCALRCAAHRLRARLHRRQPVEPLWGLAKNVADAAHASTPPSLPLNRCRWCPSLCTARPAPTPCWPSTLAPSRVKRLTAAAALPHARGAHTRPGRAARASTP
jgi:hypothetical protein